MQVDRKLLNKIKKKNEMLKKKKENFDLQQSK